MSISDRATAGIAPQTRARKKGIHCPICETHISAPEDIRSVPQLRRYFTLIRSVFEQWPLSHERQFSSPAELRAYLQIKAGHTEIGAVIPLAGIKKDRALMLVEAGIRAAGSMAFPVLQGTQIVVYKPKSIAFDKLNHLSACKLMSAVEDVIIAETGLQPEQLMNETAGAA